MSVIQVAAASVSYQTPSAYGNSTLWGFQGGNLVLNLLPGAGSLWGIWPVQVPGLPTGEVINQILVQGGDDFTVGAGGAGITRQAVLYMNMFTTVAGFSGQTGTSIDTVPGTGTGHALNLLFTKGGFTTNDLINGLFVGVAVATGIQDGSQMGVFHLSTLSLTFYTGPDNANPPPTATHGKLTDPVANYNPGKLPGIEQFASCAFQLLSPASLVGLTHVWDLPSPNIGLTFASTGNTQLIIGSQTTNSVSNTGLINIAPNTPVKEHFISCRCGTPGSPNYTLRGPLIVRAQPMFGGFFTEA